MQREPAWRGTPVPRVPRRSVVSVTEDWARDVGGGGMARAAGGWVAEWVRGWCGSVGGKDKAKGARNSSDRPHANPLIVWPYVAPFYI